MCEFRKGLLCLVVLAVTPWAAPEATPILSDPLASTTFAGHLMDIGDNLVGIYDADSDRLTISSLFAGATITDPSLPYEEWPVFTSRISINVGIDKFGNVVDAGTFLWEGDYGSGFSLVARGSVRDIGFADIFEDDVVDPYYPYRFFGLRALLNVDYFTPAISRQASHIGFYYERYWSSGWKSPFFDDWACPGGSADGLRCAPPWSTSGFAWADVPEPGTLALFGLGLVGLGFARRRKLSLASPRSKY